MFLKNMSLLLTYSTELDEVKLKRLLLVLMLVGAMTLHRIFNQ